MAIKLKLKNSVVKDKAPTPADLDIGELALNAHQDSPAAYIKDAAGVVRKIAGVGSVSTPTASDTVQGIVELATPAEATAGADATRAVTPAGLKTALAAQAGSPTAPAGPVVGQVWVDSSTSPSTIKVWGGTPAAWIAQAGATVTSATAPATPAKGQIWIDTSASPSVTKIWDGTAWVTATADGSAAAAIANDAKYATKAELQAEDLWDRTGTEISPKTAGDTVAFSIGTAALPGLHPVGDPNTGIYSPGADQLAFSTNGTLRSYWKADGTVDFLSGGSSVSLSSGNVNAYGTGSSFSRATTPNNGIFLHTGDTGANDKPRINLKGAGTTALNLTAIEVAADNGAKPGYVVQYDGTTLIGGTLPASPNITLKADGLIKAGAGTASTPYNIFKSGLQYALIVDQTDATKNCLNLNSPAVPTGGQHKSIVISEAGVGKAEHRIHDTSYEIYSDKPAFDLTCVGGRARLTNTGDFLLGGTLPASPAIKLGADGAFRFNTSGSVIRGNANATIVNVVCETSDGKSVILGARTAADPELPGYATLLTDGAPIAVVAGGGSSSGGVTIGVGATAWSPRTSESRLKDIQSDADTDQCWTLIRDIELKRYYYKDQDDKTGVSYMGPMADWLGVQDPELLIDTGRTDEHGPIHTFNQGLLEMKALAALSAALKRIEDLETRLAALEPAKTPTP